MNELIKKITGQVLDELVPQTWTTLGYDKIKEIQYRTAELIVLEMCKELDKAQWDKGEDWVCADGPRIIPQIKQHFGVEE